MKILVFGEVLWDQIKGELFIGGAPFNMAAHAGKLGADAYFVSAVGNDELGEKTLDLIKSKDIPVNFINVVNTPTCIVRVSVDENGVPVFYIDDSTSWDLIEVGSSDIDLMNSICFDCFCFGTLALRNPVSLRSLYKIIDNCTFPEIFFDMNLRLHYYDRDILDYSLKKCDIAKMNDGEVEKVRQIFGFEEKDYEDLSRKIREEFNIRYVCITCGEKGAYISSEKDFDFCAGYKVKVADTVGSGDAFSAAVIHRLLDGSSQKSACDFACKLGALVASRSGAVPDYDITELDIIG